MQSNRYVNPSTGLVEDLTMSGLWAFLFGAFYFAVKRVWSHTFIYFGLCVLSGGALAPFLWVGYAFAAKSIVSRSLIERGYVPEDKIINLTESDEVGAK